MTAKEKSHRHLKDNCNVETIVGHNYDDIVIEIHDHYKRVFARAQRRALTDQPKTYDFSTNENPQYWLNKMKNRQGLEEQCEIRGIIEDEVRICTKRDIARILITFDRDNNKL